MSEENKTTATEVALEPETPKKKRFTRTDSRKYITASVHLPKLYEDYEPWVFKMRFKLSGEANERRQEYLSLSPSKMTAKEKEQALDEVCDLLVELPEGFGDLQYDGKSAGSSYRTYVETCPDSQVKEILYEITLGASNLYWAGISPREFRG